MHAVPTRILPRRKRKERESQTVLPQPERHNRLIQAYTACDADVGGDHTATTLARKRMQVRLYRPATVSSRVSEV
jgi:hypothetical protein